MMAASQRPTSPSGRDRPEGRARAAADLIEAIRSSPLVAAAQREQLPELEKRCFPDVAAFVRELVRRGWFTRFQIEEIAAGRGPGLVLGPFRLLELLGEGGMGKVYKARHQRMDRVVALKVIRPHLLAKPETVERFYREVRAAAHLSHPNVVLAYDAAQVGDIHYLALEYVEGTDLARHVKENGPLSVAQACDAIRQAALGLQHAHERGLVHRDIKPSNLLRANQGGTIKLLDFGLALLNRVATEDDGSLTHTGTVMGTPDFMAPEQALDTHTADIRADLYSLGCTLYFLLTGRVPFPGGTGVDKRFRHREAQPEPLTTLRPGVPPEVGAIVSRLMAKSPAERYQTPGELAAILEAVLHQSSMPTEIWRAPPLASTEAEKSPDARTAGPQQDWAIIVADCAGLSARPPSRPAPSSSRRCFWLTAAGASVCLAGATVLLLVARTPAPPDPSPGPEKKAPALVKVEPSSPRLETQPQSQLPEPGPQPVKPVLAPPKPSSFRVEANQPWQDTHVAVEAGKPIVIEATGRWKKGTLLCTAAGLAESPADRNLLSESPAMCLLARIGDEETPEMVGPKSTLQPRQAGRLFVRANTLDLGDASGSLELTITGGVRQEVAGPTPRPTLVEAAEVAVPAVLERIKQRLAEPGALRAEGEAFRLRYPGTPQAVRVAGALRALPSPLDQLVPAKIPPAERFAWQRHLVSILGEHRWFPGARLHALALSDDGKLLATGDALGQIRLWDPAKGKGRLLGSQGRYSHSVAFTPNGKILFSGGHSGGLKIWNVASGKEAREQFSPLEHAASLAVSADGRILAAGFINRPTYVWDLNTNAPPLTLHVNPGDLAQCVAISPDGKTLAMGSLRTAKLWALVTRERAGKPGPLVSIRERETLTGHVGDITSVAFSPDSSTVVTSSLDKTVKLWDAVKGKETVSLQGHQGPVHAVAFTADGKQVISVGEDVRYWDPATALAKKRVVVPPTAAAPLTFSRDRETLVSAGSDGLIHLWETAAGKEWDELAQQAVSVVGVAFSPDGRTLAAAGGGQLGIVRLWDVVAGKERAVLPAHAKAATAVAYSPDGKLLATGGDDGSIKLWEAESLSPRNTLAGHTGRVTRLAFSPDSQTLASSSADNTVKLWDVAAGREKRTLPGHTAPVNYVVFAPHGRTLASASDDGSTRVWDVRTGQELSRLYCPGKYPSCVVGYTPEGRGLVAAYRPRVFEFYDRFPNPRQVSVEGPEQAAWTALAVLPDGSGCLTATRSGWLGFWDFTRGREKQQPVTVCQVEGSIYDVAVAPDCRHVAIAHAGGAVYMLRLPPNLGAGSE